MAGRVMNGKFEQLKNQYLPAIETLLCEVPAQAINCGDAMFQYAFRMLARMKIAPDRLIRLMDRAALSTLNVIEGQAQEFLMKDEAFPCAARYIEVIRGKTSGLFALPVVGA